MGSSARRYTIQITPAAERQLGKLSTVARRRVAVAIDQLAGDPRPPGVRALQGGFGGLRIRVGDYRVLYEVDDKAALVLVVRVGHRRDVYDR